MKSIKKTARIAGVLYLIIFFASPLAFMIGKGSILVARRCHSNGEQPDDF